MSDGSRLAEVFRDIQHGLPRQGPGTDAATLRALELCAELPESPRVLDIGCGPGMQTMAIARAIEAHVVAIDLDGAYLAQLNDAAGRAGLAERILTRQLDMRDLPFGDGEFDVVWSEGSAYIMGFSSALAEWRRLLRPGGYLVLSELCWTSDRPPKPFADFFAEEYPPMTDIPTRAAEMATHGYDIVEHFSLPEEGWWRQYYTPLERKLPALLARYSDDRAARGLVEWTRREIDMRRRYGGFYDYEFFVGRAGE